MAEGVIKTSQSVEVVDKPLEGKISRELFQKFESNSSLARPQSLPDEHFRMSAQSFTSSSDENTTSHENLKERKKHVKIKAQDTSEEHLSPSSTEEEILSDEEAGTNKKKKKRKLRWKWSPFKKMRRLFRHRKSPTRVKSCEELPTGCYSSTNLPSEDSDSLMNRAKSESSLVETKTKTSCADIEIHERSCNVDNPVDRTKSDSSEGIGKLLKGLKHAEDKSQEDIIEDATMTSDERESQAGSTVLDWSIRSSDSVAETAVSFEDLPSTSSLEGLQAAHDRIKVAPKHRRPPTKVRSNSSSMNPLNSGKMKPHRRSKTDPKDFTVKPKVESNSSSDVTTAIFKSQETNEEQRKEKHFADLKTKAESVITNSSPTKTEMLVSDKEGKDLKKEEKDKQNCAKDGSADSEMKHNKENQTDSKNRLVHENTEEKKFEDKILKELNNKNEEYRLSLKKGSESLDLIEPKSKSGSEPICPDTEAESAEPQKRRTALNSFESKEKSSDRDLKVRKQLENEKLVKTSVCRENQPANLPTNNVSISKMEPVVSTSTGLDEKSSLGSKASAGKETNSEQKAGFRPAMKKRSESLDVVETKGKSGPEIGSHTGAVSKPQVRRGFSLDSVESTEKSSDFKVRKLVMEKEKLGGTSVCKNNQSANTQTKKQTEVNLDEKNLLGPKESDKEASSIQPSWVELANQRSKRLSQLLNEDVKETNSQVSPKVGTEFQSTSNSAASNSDKKPLPRVKEKPAVPAKKEGLSNKVKPPKPDPSSKRFYGKVENKAPISNPSSHEMLDADLKRTGLPIKAACGADKCVVCGTAVYQMEKCSLDNWVLHRRCVKCTVCKRLLTVGNFVMAECKVYCKPHAKAVTVSM